MGQVLLLVSDSLLVIILDFLLVTQVLLRDFRLLIFNVGFQVGDPKVQLLVLVSLYLLTLAAYKSKHVEVIEVCEREVGFIEFLSN